MIGLHRIRYTLDVGDELLRPEPLPQARTEVLSGAMAHMKFLT
jgi:hypothetical protein